MCNFCVEEGLCNPFPVTILLPVTVQSQRQGSKDATPSPSITPAAMGALLDVSRAPVHERQAPQTDSASPPSDPSPSAGHRTSPMIVEAPAAASEQAVAEVAELVEVLEPVEEAQAVSVEEPVVGEDGRVSTAAGREAVPALDLSAARSPQEGGDAVSDLPADLPVIMLTGGQVTPASVLAAADGRGSGYGSRSVPGSRRQSKRVLILQPRSVPPSRRGASTRATTEPASSLSSAGSFVPMALDVAALMNPKVVFDTPDSPTPATTAPPSAALRREITSVEEEAMAEKSSTPLAATMEISSVAEDVSAEVISKEDSALSVGKEDTDVEKKGEETVVVEEKGEATAAVETEMEEKQGDGGTDPEQTTAKEHLTPAQVGVTVVCDVTPVWNLIWNAPRQ